MMKHIIIREAYDWLYIHPMNQHTLTQKEWEQLLDFLEQRYPKEAIAEYGNGRLRFINLVGVIQLHTVRIEILPKVSLSRNSIEADRAALLQMLSITRELPVQLHDETLSAYKQIDLSHVFAQLLVTELYRQIKHGLYKEYRTIAQNSKHVKGKLIVSTHMRKNAFSPMYAFSEYDELSPNIPFNQVLKAALQTIYPSIKHTSIRLQSMHILHMLHEVDDVQLSPSQLETVACNRQNKHFAVVLQLSKSILHSAAASIGRGGQFAYSFLFKMNELFERYIGNLLKQQLDPPHYKVHIQHAEKRLLLNMQTGRENILLKPDVVISVKEQQQFISRLILDTKWKQIVVNSRILYQQNDLYQMYAYITAYQSVERCILLYPRTEEVQLPSWLVPSSSPNKYIEIRTVRLDCLQHTREDLQDIYTSIL